MITMCFQQRQHILNLMRQKDGIMNSISKHEKSLAGGKTVEYTMEEPVPGKQLSAQRAYEIGAVCVQEKTKEALDLYYKILPVFVWDVANFNHFAQRNLWI